ncbi:MAG: competence/damage-inducible protein A [Rickettsiales bacterium]|nr:competence/damage-inducible protein A [Rickettsiales bacterium]
MKNKQVTSAVIIIGNEILSGRTKDLNINFLANSLVDIGIDLAEVRIVKDIENDIIFALNELRVKYDFIFTCGGIGPTHDDITSASIAKALGIEIERNQEAENLLINYYSKDKLNDARLKMADIPVGAILLDNPVSSAPGYKISNIFVFAGVPRIMQAMFEAAKEYLITGDKVYTKSISAYVTEGDIAKELSDLQSRYAEVEMGSYPFIRNERLGTSLVFRSSNTAKLNDSHEIMLKILKDNKIEIDAC